MKKTNKILSIILAILMVISIIPITASAATPTSGTCGENLTWSYDILTYTLTISGTGDMDTYNSYNRPWESYEDNIKTVIIKDGVTKLGNYAFYHCENLIYATIPESVTSVGSHTFRYCTSLIGVSIPNSVTSLDDSVFESCRNLTDVVIGNSVTSIGFSTFKECSSLTNVTIPNSVSMIFGSAFSNCTNLKSIILGNNVSIIASKAFDSCSQLEDIYYSGTEKQWSGISIGSGNTSLESATIHYNSTGNNGTEHTHSYDIDIIKQPTCTEQGYTTYTCECSDSYTITFSALGHTEEEIPAVYPTTTTTGLTPGEKCKTCGEILVQQRVVPVINDTMEIGFISNSLWWTFDTSTGVLEFFGEGPIDDYEVDLFSHDYIDTRPWANFYNLIEHVVINDGITHIGTHTFEECYLLTIITIPESVTSIGEYAFSSTELLVVYYKGTEAEWNNINVEYGNWDLYESHRFYFVDFPISDSGTCGDAVTWNFDATTSTLTISGTGPIDGDREWDYYKYHIEKIVITDGVTSIGRNVFNYHPNLKEVVIPDTVTEIQISALDNCKTLSDIYYSGTEEDWNNIRIWECFFLGIPNSSYKQNATIHYNYCVHEYSTVVTLPTCTEHGFTTYTCECGDSYVDDYVDALGHTEEIIPAVAPTCTETGLTEGAKCSVCGETLTEQEIVPATGHNDSDNDGYCDDCDEQLCDHNCHKSGVLGFFWKIINIFNRIFGLNKVCECGVAHY